MSTQSEVCRVQGRDSQSGLLLLQLVCSLLRLELKSLHSIHQQISRPSGLVWSHCGLLQIYGFRCTLLC